MYEIHHLMSIHIKITSKSTQKINKHSLNDSFNIQS
jgi:hypothetical protein